LHQRANERYSPQSTIEVTDTIADKSVGVLINISATGFMLASIGSHPIPGTLLQLKLIETENQSLDISLGASCLWKDEASAEDTYWSGFEIIDISDQDQQTLNNYIESLKPKN